MTLNTSSYLQNRNNLFEYETLFQQNVIKDNDTGFLRKA